MRLILLLDRMRPKPLRRIGGDVINAIEKATIAVMLKYNALVGE